jgi:hypothetical protein
MSQTFLHMPDPGQIGPFIVNLLAAVRSTARLPGPKEATARAANACALVISPASAVLVDGDAEPLPEGGAISEANFPLLGGVPGYYGRTEVRKRRQRARRVAAPRHPTTTPHHTTFHHLSSTLPAAVCVTRSSPRSTAPTRSSCRSA